jgi:hypothetical protein
MGAISLWMVVLGLQHDAPQLLASAALNVVLMWGLTRGYRWAFILVLVFGLIGIGVAMDRSPTAGVWVAVGNGIVLLPMILSTRFFFPAPPGQGSETGSAGP